MRGKTSPLWTRRRRVATLALPAALLLAGCGSSSHSSTKQPICPHGQATCVSTNPHAKVNGSLGANLKQWLSQTDRKLTQVKLNCPSKVQRFPVTCKLTGIRKIGRKSVPVQGTATVLGINTKLHNYEVQTVYAPIRGAS
jgi:hypothetical protein